MIVYLNGSYVDRDRALVSVDDRGFVFGDGIYEVTRAVRGALFEPHRHLARLRRSLDGIEIAFGDAELDGLLEVSDRLLAENDLRGGEALVYVQITRGTAPRAHNYPSAETAPTVFVSAGALASPADRCARGGSAILYPDIRWQRCDLKTVNLLPNVMANQVAYAAGAYEALFVRDGVVSEGTRSNVFAVVDDELRTHPASERILRGITRDVVLELAAEEGIPIREAAFTVDELRSAGEAFVTGTASDVMPIVELDGRKIGDGAPGPVTRRLYAALASRIEAAGAARV